MNGFVYIVLMFSWTKTNSKSQRQIENVLVVLIFGLHRNEEEWHFKMFAFIIFNIYPFTELQILQSYGVWTVDIRDRYDTLFWMGFHEIEIKIDLPFWYCTDLRSDHFHLQNVICTLVWLIANDVLFHALHTIDRRGFLSKSIRFLLNWIPYRTKNGSTQWMFHIFHIQHCVISANLCNFNIF